jgi:hypothetical protein
MSASKILVTGPGGAGKTTFIRSLAGQEAVSTDVETTSSSQEAHTTVGLDHGTVDLEGRRLSLFGTPGQQRFEYMWDVLSGGTNGLILLVPADGAEALGQALAIMRHVAEGQPPPFTVGVTRMDLGGDEVLRRAESRLSAEAVQVAPLDAREPEQCRSVLAGLSAHLPE